MMSWLKWNRPHSVIWKTRKINIKQVLLFSIIRNFVIRHGWEKGVFLQPRHFLVFFNFHLRFILTYNKNDYFCSTLVDYFTHDILILSVVINFICVVIHFMRVPAKIKNITSLDGVSILKYLNYFNALEN